MNLLEPTTTSVNSGPFKFLDFYTERDEARFAGRDCEVREVIARITSGPTFVIYGRSGLGKTSLLLAGVFPGLRQRQFEPIYARTLQSPLADLRQTVAKHYEATPAISQAKDLRSMLSQASQSGPVVLVLDQFEEFYIRFRDKTDEREQFIHEIVGLLRDTSIDLRLVLSLREDYLAELDDFRTFLPNLFANQFRLLPLTAFGTRQTIERQLLHSGVVYEPQLLRRLVDQLAEEGFDPPLLQITCSELYRQAASRAGNQVELRKPDLENLGGLEGIFRRYLEEVLKGLDSHEHFLVRTVLDALITQERTKQATTIESLRQGDFVASKEEISNVMERLHAHRLVRRDPRGEEVWYELIHERLVPIVLAWLELDRDFFNFRLAKQLITNSARGAVWRENPETLLNEGQFKGVVGPYQERLRLDELQTEFLLWTAIYRRLDALPYWAGKFGQKKTVSLLAFLLNERDANLRRGAAEAVARVSVNDESLANRCLELALKDPSPEVRRSAGSSLAGVAGETQLHELQQALGAKQTRRTALEILADFHASKRTVAGLSWWQSRRGRNIADGRIFAKQAQTIRARANLGALSGLLAGLAWASTVGVLIANVLGWLNGPDEDNSVLFVALYWVLGTLMVGLGALVGWRTAAVAAKEAALRGEGQWFQAVMRCRGFFFVLFSFALIFGLKTFAVAREFFGPGDAWLVEFLLVGIGLMAAYAATVLFQSAVASVVRINRNNVWPGVPEWGIWVQSLIASAGLPLFVPLMLTTVIVTIAGENFSKWGESLGLTLVVVSITVSFLTAVITIALARSAKKAPLGEVPAITPRARWPHRLLGLGSVLALPVWFALMFGLDAIPLWHRPRTLRPNEPLSFKGEFGRTWPVTHYYRIRNRGTNNALALITEMPTTAKVTVGAQVYRSQRSDASATDGALLIPRGTHHVAIGNVPTATIGPPVPYSFTIQPVILVSAEDSGKAYGPARRRPVYLQSVCRLVEPTTNQWIWEGTVAGRLREGEWASTNVVAISLGNVLLWGKGMELKNRPVFTATNALLDAQSYFTLLPAKDERKISRIDFNSTPNEYAFIKTNGAWLAKLRVATLKNSFVIDNKENAELHLILVAALEVLSASDQSKSGVRFLEEDKFDKAAIAFQKAVELDPGNAGYVNGLAWSQFRAGRNQEALRNARRAVQLEGDKPNYHHTLAHAAYATANWKESSAAWDQVLQLEKDYFEKPRSSPCQDDKTRIKDAKDKAER